MTATQDGVADAFAPCCLGEIRRRRLLLLALAPFGIALALLVVGALLHTPLVLAAIAIGATVLVILRGDIFRRGVTLKRRQAQEAQRPDSRSPQQATAIVLGTQVPGELIKPIRHGAAPII